MITRACPQTSGDLMSVMSVNVWEGSQTELIAWWADL